MDAGEAPETRQVGTFEFNQLLRRAELPPMTKLVAFAYASYASPDGDRIWPGERRVADELDLTERAVRGHVGALRACGLLTRVRAHSPGRAAEYLLSWPLDGDRVPMRLDPDGRRMSPRVVHHRNPRSGVEAVENPEHRNPDSGVASAEPAPHRNPDSGNALSPERVSTHTGTPVPDTPEPPFRSVTRVTKEGPNTSGSPKATVSRGAENGHPPNQIDPSLQPPPNPTAEAYAEARDALISLPDFGGEFMALATKQYAAEGWLSVSYAVLTVRAAQLAKEAR